METMVRVTDRVPNLRVVLDHLPQMDPAPATPACTNSPNGRRFTSRSRRSCAGWTAASPRIWRSTGRGWTSSSALFGEDRLVYGSDWPNSDNWGAYPTVFRIVHEYFTAKGRAVAEKYFWKNSVKAYQWVKRAAGATRLEPRMNTNQHG